MRWALAGWTLLRIQRSIFRTFKGIPISDAYEGYPRKRQLIMEAKDDRTSPPAVIVDNRSKSMLDLRSVLPLPSWSNMSVLREAEKKILLHLWDSLETEYVPIYSGKWKLRTISMNKESKATPLVLVHGMGAGLGLWVLNLQFFARVRPVYALDLLGFGQSSRPEFPNDPMLAELEFVESIEEWRKSMNLDKFILLGHSLGGFLSTSYAIRYPDRVRHLILADPWGFPEPPNEAEQRTPIPTWIEVLARLLQPFNPFAILRAAGPLGPSLVSKLRSDLMQKFGHLFEDNTVADYVYHCNAQNPSGEVAFKVMTEGFGWAKYPMINRITDVPAFIPMTIIYGSRSWVDSGVGWQVKYMRSDSFVDVQVIKGAGHHVYADRADMFNLLVSRSCIVIDQHIDRTSTLSKRKRMRSESSPSLSQMESSIRKPLTTRRSSKNLVSESEVPETDDEKAARVRFSLAEEDDEELNNPNSNSF